MCLVRTRKLPRRAQRRRARLQARLRRASYRSEHGCTRSAAASTAARSATAASTAARKLPQRAPYPSHPQCSPSQREAGAQTLQSGAHTAAAPVRREQARKARRRSQGRRRPLVASETDEPQRPRTKLARGNPVNSAASVAAMLACETQTTTPFPACRAHSKRVSARHCQERQRPQGKNRSRKAALAARHSELPKGAHRGGEWCLARVLPLNHFMRHPVRERDRRPA